MSSMMAAAARKLVPDSSAAGSIQTTGYFYALCIADGCRPMGRAPQFSFDEHPLTRSAMFDSFDPQAKRHRILRTRMNDVLKVAVAGLGRMGAIHALHVHELARDTQA